ncbi:MAG: CHC2 zinc finger domain-containing protein [Vulcanimicrobiota bacterium]
MTPTQDRTEIEELKASVDLASVMENYGVTLKPSGKSQLGCCPFHDDDKPSLSITGGLWQCFGCQAGGDVISFLQLKEKIDFPSAVKLLKSWSGRPDADERAKRTQRAEVMERMAHLYHQAFWESADAQNYLKARGLDDRDAWQAFRIGYCDGSLAKKFSGGPAGETLQELGFLNSDGKEHFRGCLVVPLMHPDRGVVGFYGRRLAGDAGRHVYLPGPRQGVLNWLCLRTSSRIYVTEGVLDALSLWQAGLREVTCLHGLAGVSGDLKELLKRHRTKEVVLCLDGDKAGQDALLRLQETFEGLRVSVASLQLPAGQDPNLMLQTLGASGLAKWFADAEEPTKKAEDVKHESNPQGFAMEFGEVHYEVQMMPPFSARLRIRLCGQRGELEYLDKLDLYVQRARQQAGREIARALKLQRFEADNHLKKIREQAEQWVAARHSLTPPDKKNPEPMTAGEREEALAALRAPDLVQTILRDMEDLGYVGEEDAKILAYLVGLSRKLAKPLSAIIFAQSGCGKSSLADLVEFLTPPDEVFHFTRLTSQALYYFPTALSHMLIFVEERSGAEAADYSIRALQTQHKLTQAVPIKDPATGQFKTQVLEVEGPVAYVETTTSTRTNHENATRSFEIYLDESEEQTRRIHAAQRQARLPVNYNRELRRTAIQQRHHAMQKLLEPVQIGIPYVDHLDFPAHRLRTRRDHERFLCLIEVSTFLHQHQRPGGVTDDGTQYVLANLDDYGLAYTLAKEVLASSLHELNKNARELWEKLVEWPQAQGEAHFSRRELREHFGLEDHRLRDALADLVEMEYLETVAGGGSGKQWRYRLIVRNPSGMRLSLKTPAELARDWHT